MQSFKAMMMMSIRSVLLPGRCSSSSFSSSSSSVRLLGWCCFLLVINGIVPAATTTVTSTTTNTTTISTSSAADSLANVHDGIIGMADNDIGHGNSERILSRKRRYLIFPQGSSMQLGEFRRWGRLCLFIFSVFCSRIGM